MGSMSSPVIHHEDDYRDLAGQKVLSRSYMASSRKVSDPKVKLMSSYGGKILPRPSDNKLRYAGGDTRMISVSRFIRFNDLESKMNEIYGPNLTIKYQLPEEDLDALVTVSSDEDLENMMDEYDRLDASEGPSSRLRLFVFASSDGDSIDLHDISDPRISEQQYVDAVNALQIDAPFRRNGDMLSATSSKNLDDLLHGWDPLPVHEGLQSLENLQFSRLYPSGKPLGFANSPNPLHSSSSRAALSRQHSDSSDFAANWHANNPHAVPLAEATRDDHAEAVSRKLSDLHVYAYDCDARNSLTGAATREDSLRSLSKVDSNPLADLTSDWCANSPPIGVQVRKDHLEPSVEFAGSSRPTTNDLLDTLSRNLSDSPKFAAHRNAYTHTIGETIGLNKALSRRESGSSDFASNLHANAANISPITGTIREDPLEPLLRNHPDSPKVASNWNADANANELPIGRIIGAGQAVLMQRSNSSSEVPSNKHLETKRFPLSGVSREDLSEVLLRQLSSPSVATSNWHADGNVSPITKVAIEVPFGTLARQISGSSELASNWNANKNVLPATKSFSSDVGSSVPVNADENRDAPPVGTVIGANLLDQEFSVSNLHVNSNENRDIPSIGAGIGANILDRESGGSASSSTSSQYGLHYSPSLHQWNPGQLMQPLGEAVSYANGKDTLNKGKLGHITSPVGQVQTVEILDMSAILQMGSTDMHMKTDVIPNVDEDVKSYPDVSEAIPLSPGAILQKQLEIDRNENLDVTSTEGLQTLISKMEELHEQPIRNVWTQIDSSASPHLIPDLLSASPQIDDLLSEFIPASATCPAPSSSEAGRRDILEKQDLFSMKTETDLEKAFPHSGYMSALHSPVASGATLEQEPVTQGLSAKVVHTHNHAHELAEQSLAYVTDYTASLNHSTAAVWGNLQTPPQLASHYGLNDKGLDLNEVPLNAAADVDVTLEQSDVAPTLEDHSTVAMPLLSKVGGSNLPSSQGMEPEESVSLSPLAGKVGSLRLSSPYRADPDENVSVPATKLYPYSLATDTGGFSRTNAASVASQSDKLTINLSKPSSVVDLSSTGVYENRFVTADRMNKDVLTEGSEEVEHSGGSHTIHVKTEIVVGGEEDRPVAGEEPLPPLAFHAPASMIDVWSTTRSQYEQDVTVPPVNHLEDVDEKSDTEEMETFQSAVGTINDTVIKPKKVAATAGKDPIALNLQTILYSDLEELRELGSGTFGTVYHGKWRGTDVAIKRIKSTCFTGRPSERGRMISDFWQEALILGQLHHPNVVAFYGIVPHGPDGTLATVTEFMVNGSLKQALQKKDRILDRRKRLLIAMDAAFGMEYLHGKNIVHFDLKCDNLLVNLRDTHRPICKVGDLGLSKIKQQTMISGGVRGTLPWMAPELLNGSSSLVSEKVDVFSFGIVLWEILTGEEPYADMHYGAIIGGIVSNTLRPPVPRWCDATYRALMEACWSADPSERPSFSEIARSLRSMEAALAAKGRAQSPISGQE